MSAQEKLRAFGIRSMTKEKLVQQKKDARATRAWLFALVNEDSTELRATLLRSAEIAAVDEFHTAYLAALDLGLVDDRGVFREAGVTQIQTGNCFDNGDGTREDITLKVHHEAGEHVIEAKCRFSEELHQRIQTALSIEVDPSEPLHACHA